MQHASQGAAEGAPMASSASWGVKVGRMTWRPPTCAAWQAGGEEQLRRDESSLAVYAH